MADEEKIDALRDSIIASIREKTGGFLDGNAAAFDFLKDRAARMAKLTFEYARASDDDQPKIKRRMDSVSLAIETEALNVVADASQGAKEWWKDVVRIVFDFAKEYGPVLIKKVIARV